MTEQQPYEVLEQGDGFELRHYPAHVVAQVEIEGSFEDAGNRAFRSLFRYITGNNRAQESISMTAPVVQREAASEKVAMTAPVVQAQTPQGGYVVAFVLPASLSLETAPVPSDPDVQVRAVPERTAAAVRYSGRWSQSSYEHHLTELLDAVAGAGLVPTGSPRFARFRPALQALVPAPQRGRAGRRPALGLARYPRRGSSWGMADVSPLPIRGEVVVDARGGARAMRVSWHPEHGVVVLSIWRGNTCIGTMQVDTAEVPHLVDVLVRGLAAGAAAQPLQDAG